MFREKRGGVILPFESKLRKKLKSLLKNPPKTKMKSIFKLLANVLKYGSIIAVVLNILRVAMEEIQEKFPDILDEPKPEPVKESPTPEILEKPKKGLSRLFDLPF
jgi:hypothetical protein